MYRLIGAILMFAPVLAGLSSCGNLINDDLDPCEEGVRLRFIYDYNMEFANAFPSQVTCLTLLVYDGNGGYMERVDVTDPALLGDEDWRMDLKLAPGKYRLLAYGGMACEKSTFHFVTPPAHDTTVEAVSVAMDDRILEAPTGTQLHHLFYGSLDVEVPPSQTAYREYTLPMMKDTNTIRVLLQNVDGTPLDDRDFDFTITDDNTLLDRDNFPMVNGAYEYRPWTSGRLEGGQTEDGEISYLAFAEFSTSRLIDRPGATLTIVRKSDGRTVLSIPLVRYLQMLRSQEFADMEPQEFLDRESRWSLILFLDSQTGSWITTRIVINDWVIRINDIEA